MGDVEDCKGATADKPLTGTQVCMDPIISIFRAAQEAMEMVDARPMIVRSIAGRESLGTSSNLLMY